MTLYPNNYQMQKNSATVSTRRTVIAMMMPAISPVDSSPVGTDGRSVAVTRVRIDGAWKPAFK